MKNFAAIDFETANRCPSSICSIGVVTVRDGEIADRVYRFVRPFPEHYDSINTSIHGLGPDDTRTAPTFPEVWSDIAPRIEGLTLVAHNSVFDETCLKAAFAAHGIDYPGYVFRCTCRASRRVFGRSLPNHKLDTVAARCGFDLRNHHHALADALACAHIALRILPDLP